MLYPAHYAKACQDYTGGHIIDHNPDGGLDAAARTRRLQNTQIGLRSLFGRNDVDTEIWSLSNRKRGRDSNQEDAEESGEAAAEEDDDENITFQIRYLNTGSIGTTKTYTIHKGAMFADSLVNYKSISTAPIEFVFLYHQKRVIGTCTPESIRMLDFTTPCGHVITPSKEILACPPLPPSQNNPVTLRVRDQTGEETFFKIRKNTRMYKVFETYADRKGVWVNDLRFLLDGARIEAWHTPMGLELDDQDQIDCMLEQTGC
ncbi:Small ubiquitin-related modifier [Seminavis robusta]|uniref:Small ubiquitin-related modifier n=1 Tax=Seminavis robusta TaxID=568900 RepID=A0A9N8E9P9_9STRA|nr:Small ubiquitin-related modifier [Seminavis robusta]|eukprot:Sro663_g183500.1 Small ubiquitin-related modifier (260) ;mRNA; f:25112-25891